MKIPGIKITRLKKILNPEDLPQIPGIFRKSRKNSEIQKIVKTHNFFLYFHTRDFFGIFRGFEIPIPISGIFGIFRVLQKLIPILNTWFQ